MTGTRVLQAATATHHPMRRVCTIAFVLVFGLFSPCAFAEDEPEKERDYRYGSIRLGGFWVDQIDFSIVARSPNFPVGIFIDLSKELGLGEAVAVPRGIFSYRFSRRHQVNANFYRIRRDNQVVFERTIEIGGSEFPVGVQVDMFSDTKFFKAAYTWLFYDTDKVALGASFGVNIVDLDLGLSVAATAGPGGQNAIKESAGVTVPVPVFGLRVAYRATPKLSIVAAADLLSAEVGEYGGSFRDSYALLDWRFSKYFSVGGGFNVLNLDVELEGDTLAELRHNYRGMTAFVGFHF